MSNVDVRKLIEQSDLIDQIINEHINWEEKHHALFYMSMIVKELYVADPALMDDYIPKVGSNRGEVEHLQAHIGKKVAYLKEFV